MSDSVRVLLVPESPAVGEDVVAFLEEEVGGFAVTVAPTAGEALDRLRGGPFDCVVSGYSLPERDGIEFLESVREPYPRLPFVLYTDADSEAVAAAAVSADVTEYVRRDDAGGHAVLADALETVVGSRDSAVGLDDPGDRVERILATVPACVVELDRDGQFVYVNRRAEEILGLERSQVTGRTYNDPDWEIRDLDGEPIPDERLPFRQVLDSGEPIEGFRHTVCWPDGSEKVLSVSGVPLFDDRGRVESVVFSLSDVTERVEGEQQLRRREEQLNRLHGATRELLSCTSQQEAATVASRTAVEILEFPMNGVHLYDETVDGLRPAAVSEASEELLGEAPIIDRGVAWEAFQQSEERLYDDVREADEAYNPESPMRGEIHLPLGEYGVFIVSATEPDAFDEHDIELARILAANTEAALERIGRERTLREREAELEQQNERLDEFASIVSHDLRNPLNVAQGRAELLAAEYDGEHLAPLRAELDRMEDLVSDVLTLAREGKIVAETEPIQLTNLIGECWRSVSTETATIEIADEVTIRGDRSRLRNVFENLFRNAIEHGGADVTVRVGRIDDGIYVEDDGPGIPEAERDRLFDPGYTSASNGTGFGLTIVRRIVEAHGWDVDVTTGTDGGARFEITGPL